MNKKDAEVIKILSQLGMRDERQLTPKEEQDFQTALDPDLMFLDDVERLFAKPTVEQFVEDFKTQRNNEQNRVFDDIKILFQTVLKEMAYKTGLDFPVYTSQQLEDVIYYFKSASHITNLEQDGRFSLYKKDNFYILRDKEGDITYGWANVSPITLNQTTYQHLQLIYVLPQYRKTGVSKVLFHGIKQTTNTPIVIDGPIFKAGEKFIDSLSKTEHYNIWVFNKKTNTKQQYHGFLSSKHGKEAIIFEGERAELFIRPLPISDYKIYIPHYPEVVV